MRKILLLLLVVTLNTSVKSQDLAGAAKIFKTEYTDSLAVIAQMSELAAMSGCKYITHDDRGRYLFQDSASTLPIKPEIIFTLNRYYKDRNLELGRLGELRYGISMDVYGSFFALIPIWKKYFDSAADAEKLSTDYGDSVYVIDGNVKRELARLDRGSGKWFLRIVKNRLP